jgi:hypothetical protein
MWAWVKTTERSDFDEKGRVPTVLTMPEALIARAADPAAVTG